MVYPQGSDVSSYVAGLQYAPLFRESGYEVRTAGLLEVPRGRPARALHSLARALHFRALENRVWRASASAWEDEVVDLASSCDVVYSIKIRSLEFHRRIRDLRGPRLLFCFGDALWLPQFRAVGWGDLEEILRTADAVTCVNEYTAAYVRPYNPRVSLVPDCPQIENFDARRGRVRRESKRATLGWVGTPGTAGSLHRVFEVLEDLAKKSADWDLRLVGAGSGFQNLPRFEHVRWTERPTYDADSMVDEVLGMDIGIAPLYFSEDSRARGNLKAAVYMSGGAVPVCQDLADFRDLIDDGVNGFLAKTSEDWAEKLGWLIRHPTERREMSERAVATIRARLTKRICFDHLREAVRSLS